MRLRLHTLGAILAASLTALTPPAVAASSGDHSPASADSAEGFWVARMPAGVNVKWATLDGGETWGIHAAQGTILGAFHGVTRSANGALQGRYEGEALSSRRPVMGMSLQVTEGGAFVIMSMQDCAASGTATPRPGGKNVFNVSLHFAGRACPLGDGVHATSGELFILGMNEAHTDGWLYLGQRQ